MEGEQQLLEKIFNQKKDKSGIILTANQLYQYAKKQNKLISKNTVSNYLKSKQITARFSTPAKRPKAFQTISYPRIGLYFLDYAEFRKDLAFHNKQNTGFLLAVENLTNRLFVYPCKGKSSEEWEKAVSSFVEIVQNVSVIYTDRDAVATSSKFQKKISDLYNIRWYFMVKGSKSYLAERYIRFVKEKLSQALIVKQSKNWIQFVQPIVDEYNKEKIEHTSYSRGSISADNFNHFLSQRLQLHKNTSFAKQYLPHFKLSDDPTLLFNSSRIYSSFLSKDWNNSIFTFAPGDKVLLARRSDWNDKTTGVFFKASRWGTFSSDVYTVSSRQLRATKYFKGYVPVYTLQEIGPDRTFYASELKHTGKQLLFKKNHFFLIFQLFLKKNVASIGIRIQGQ